MGKTKVSNTVIDGQFVVAPTAEFPDPRWTVVTQSLALQPTSSALVQGPVNEQLLARHYETERIANNNAMPIHFVGYHGVFSGTKVYPGDGCDWAFMNLTEDPLFTTNNRRLLMPRRVKMDLNAAVKAGINFDAIFIAHEIPEGSLKPGQSVPLELVVPPPPPAMMRRLNSLGQLVETFWQGVVAAFAVSAAMPLVAGAAGATVTAGAATATATLLPAILVDPILFGVHLDQETLIDGQPFGMWYYLTQWDW